MKIIVAKHAGFCFGVKRAIEIAEETASTNGKTYVYGQLVHNERVIEDLGEKGIEFVDDIKDIPKNAVTVLRAHGEPGVTYEKLRQKGIFGDRLKDATCPLVKLVHNAAIKLKANGYEVIIFGKKNHPESIGISYYINGKNTFIAENPNDAALIAEHINKNNLGKAAIISQTTMSVNGYNKLIQNINKKCNSKFEKLELNLKNIGKPFVFVDTICNPTKQRQSDTEEIAKKADGYTGADLEALAREAALLSLRENINAEEVHKKHFEEALNKVKPSVTTNTIKVYKKVEEQFLKSAKSATPTQEGSYLG